MQKQTLFASQAAGTQDLCLLKTGMIGVTSLQGCRCMSMQTMSQQSEILSGQQSEEQHKEEWGIQLGESSDKQSEERSLAQSEAYSEEGSEAHVKEQSEGVKGVREWHNLRGQLQPAALLASPTPLGPCHSCLLHP